MAVALHAAAADWADGVRHVPAILVMVTVEGGVVAVRAAVVGRQGIHRCGAQQAGQQRIVGAAQYASPRGPPFLFSEFRVFPLTC